MTQGKRALFRALYAACLIAFAIGVSGFYREGTGFTSFILFGKDFAARSLPEVRATPHYVAIGSGYDGQFYAQLAVRPAPWDPEVYRALDNPWYRAGRILPSFIACGLSFGKAAWAIHVYSVECVVAWLVLALLLLHWFPPSSSQNFVRWGGCMFCAGMAMAVCRALPDVVALMLVAAGGYFWERGVRWGPLLMGLSGLAKETGLATTIAFVDELPHGRARWLRMAENLALAIVPSLLWLVTIRVIGGGYSLADGAFSAPFVGLVERVAVTFSPKFRGDWWKATAELSVPISVLVQAIFLVTRFQPKDWRWRVGVIQVPFMAILGKTVWEGYPIAAARVLLPMTLMFNLLVPATRYSWVWLVLGNLSVLSGIDVLASPP